MSRQSERRPAAFLTPLDMRKIGERAWLLLDDLHFYSAKYDGIVVAPRGFQMNLASIPRPAFALFPPIGLYDRPAVIHDGGYGNALITVGGDRIFTTKAVADSLFLEGMRAEHVNGAVAQIMYRSVRAFGNPLGHPLRQR